MPSIASLLASGTEIVAALGHASQLVAVSHECDYPPEIAALPRVTSAAVAADRSSAQIDSQVREAAAAGQPLYQVDWATLARLRPEVLVTQAHCEVCAVNYHDVCRQVAEVPELRGARIVALQPDTLAAVFDDVARLAEAIGDPQRGRQLIEQLRFRIETVRASTRLAPRPRVVCLEWVDPQMVAANWMPELIELAGATNTLTRAGERTVYSRWEDVVAFDPEVLVVAPCGFDLERAWGELAILERLPGWNQLAAVRGGRVWAADGNAYFNRSGPRLIDSLEILAWLVHPDRCRLPATIVPTQVARPM